MKLKKSVMRVIQMPACIKGLPALLTTVSNDAMLCLTEKIYQDPHYLKKRVYVSRIYSHNTVGKTKSKVVGF